MRTSLPLGTLMAVAVRALQAGTFFVSPPGDDANPGTEAEPFATLSRAQAAVRQAKGAGPVTVFLRGGTYYLSETLVFTAEDSGTANAPVSWQAWQDEQPVISGGAKLALKWEAFRDGIMKARVPAGFTTDQLFVNGERQILARYPNFDPNVRILNGYSKDAFGPDRAARWADPRGGFIHAMHAHLWGDFHYLITGKDVEGQLTYEGGWQNNRRLGMHKEFRFVENIFEELDAPGEWFLDAKASMLYFHPPAGLDLARATVEGVRLRHLIEFRGAEARPVKFISLKGLTFRHAARTFMDNKEPLLRSDWTTYRGGAVFFNGAEDCALEECVLDQLGGNAIFINNYNRRLTIRGCEIAKAGANGVAFVGDPNAVRSPLFEYNQVQELAKLDRTPGPKSRNYPADCRVEDCLIHLTGRVEKQTAAVQIAMAQDITVRQCSIYDVPRAGINIGDGCWGGHVIEFCDVFDTVKETGDHGSFNSWGRDRYWRPSIEEVNAWVKAAPDLPLLDTVKPVILRHNRWRCDHGWDIDLDDGSSNYEIRNNLCLNGGLKNREGFHRVVENNVIVNNSFHPHVWYAESQDIFRRNIVFGGYQPIRVNKPWGRECDFNLVHQPGADDERPATKLQEQSGRDERSILAGALFVDAGRGDYRVKDGSPALKLGFQNFPMDQFGVQSPKLKARARTPELPALKPKSTGDAGKRDGRVVDSVCKPPALPEDSSSLTVPGSRSAPGATRLALPLTPPLSRREWE
ncbi:MAG: right-handed parallel beta-helix repeat-containing protein, partial [Verrucomicrobia bacterium]|nr:right-handed parallel beta-helix repeat-containing protein [Verrucomicrobiota bacterium]